MCGDGGGLDKRHSIRPEKTKAGQAESREDLETLLLSKDTTKRFSKKNLAKNQQKIRVFNVNKRFIKAKERNAIAEREAEQQRKNDADRKGRKSTIVGGKVQSERSQLG